MPDLIATAAITPEPPRRHCLRDFDRADLRLSDWLTGAPVPDAGPVGPAVVTGEQNGWFQSVCLSCLSVVSALSALMGGQ